VARSTLRQIRAAKNPARRRLSASELAEVKRRAEELLQREAEIAPVPPIPAMPAVPAPAAALQAATGLTSSTIASSPAALTAASSILPAVGSPSTLTTAGESESTSGGSVPAPAPLLPLGSAQADPALPNVAAAASVYAAPSSLVRQPDYPHQHPQHPHPVSRAAVLAAGLTTPPTAASTSARSTRSSPTEQQQQDRAEFEHMAYVRDVLTSSSSSSSSGGADRVTTAAEEEDSFEEAQADQDPYDLHDEDADGDVEYDDEFADEMSELESKSSIRGRTSSHAEIDEVQEVSSFLEGLYKQQKEQEKLEEAQLEEDNTSDVEAAAATTATPVATTTRAATPTTTAKPTPSGASSDPKRSRRPARSSRRRERTTATSLQPLPLPPAQLSYDQYPSVSSLALDQLSSLDRMLQNPLPEPSADVLYRLTQLYVNELTTQRVLGQYHSEAESKALQRIIDQKVKLVSSEQSRAQSSAQAAARRRQRHKLVSRHRDSGVTGAAAGTSSQKMVGKRYPTNPVVGNDTRRVLHEAKQHPEYASFVLDVLNSPVLEPRSLRRFALPADVLITRAQRLRSLPDPPHTLSPEFFSISHRPLSSIEPGSLVETFNESTDSWIEFVLSSQEGRRTSSLRASLALEPSVSLLYGSNTGSWDTRSVRGFMTHTSETLCRWNSLPLAHLELHETYAGTDFTAQEAAAHLLMLEEKHRNNSSHKKSPSSSTSPTDKEEDSSHKSQNILPHHVHAASRFVMARRHLFASTTEPGCFKARSRSDVLTQLNQSSRRERFEENMFILRCAKKLNQRALLNRRACKQQKDLFSQPAAASSSDPTNEHDLSARRAFEQKCAAAKLQRYARHSELDLPVELQEVLRVCSEVNEHASSLSSLDLAALAEHESGGGLCATLFPDLVPQGEELARRYPRFPRVGCTPDALFLLAHEDHLARVPFDVRPVDLDLQREYQEDRHFAEALRDATVPGALCALPEESPSSICPAIRRVLSVLGYPTTPGGAYELLCDLGEYTSKTDPFVEIVRHAISSVDEKQIVPELAKSLGAYSRTESLKDNVDLTHLRAYAIDDLYTSECDDAVSLVTKQGREWVYVHIADPSSVIEIGGQIDRFARERGASWMLSGSRFPMLPSAVTDPCSLHNATEARPTITVAFTLDPVSSEIQKCELFPSIIVPSRLDYDGTNRMLEHTGEKTQEKQQEIDDLARLVEITLKRALAKRSRADTEHDTMTEYRDSPSRFMVKQCMTLANFAVAAFANEHKLHIPYHHQEGDWDPFEVTNKARPVAKLGINAYTRATSPLRRYLDLVTHRQIKAYITGRSAPYSETEITELIDEQTIRVGAINFCRLLSERFWLLRFFQNEPPTQTYKGMVVDVGHGFYHVRLHATGWNVLVPQPPNSKLLPSRSEVSLGLVAVHPEEGWVRFRMVPDGK